MVAVVRQDPLLWWQSGCGCGEGDETIGGVVMPGCGRAVDGMVMKVVIVVVVAIVIVVFVVAVIRTVGDGV